MSSTKSDSEQIPPKNNTKGYGKIILTLKNQLLPEDKLETTPSQLDGLDPDIEIDLRVYGCELIQTAGILLKLPQVAMATGQVLLQRFYYSKSLVRHPVEPTAMACVCLASKIEEAPRRARDVINVFNHIRQVTSNKPIVPIILDQNYIQLKNQVIKAERRVLKELGFCVHIKHPHKIIVMYLQVLGYEKHQQLMQYSWNYMNDSLRTDVFVRYQPETVACACIYLTARKLKLPLPKNPIWFSLFGVTEDEIKDVALRILRLYSRPKTNIDLLEKKTEDLCKKYRDSKIKTRSNSGVDTPNNDSPDRQKSGAHNAWGGFISRSGAHATASAEKHSPSKSGSPSPAANKYHKRPKKHRSRSRTPTRNHKKSHKRRISFSRSRSSSPAHKAVKKARDKHHSRSNSIEKETKNDRYIDRYDKYYDKYKEDRYIEKDRYEDKRDRYEEKKDKYDKKYERDRLEYREDRYKEDKYKEDKYKEDKYKEDKYKEDRFSNRDEKEKYKKSKHRDEERVRDRSKDRRK